MARIIGTGSYLPPTCLSNQAFISLYGLDSSPDWIEQRTGIKQRYFSEHGIETLSLKACQNLLAKCPHVNPSEINLIILASMSSRLPTPSLATRLQGDLGAEGAWGFDMSGACASFVMALDVANAIGLRYSHGYTLVIGVEKMSDVLNFSDRGTCILFGDGAGAVLIENDGQALLGYQSQMFNDPSMSKAIRLDQTTDGLLEMEGRTVFNFVNRQVIPSVSNFVKEDQDLTYLICHQANLRLLKLFGQKINHPKLVIPTNIERVANISAASIPLVLDELVEQDKIQLNKKTKIALSGFGGGLSWGHASFYL